MKTNLKIEISILIVVLLSISLGCSMSNLVLGAPGNQEPQSPMDQVPPQDQPPPEPPMGEPPMGEPPMEEPPMEPQQMQEPPAEEPPMPEPPQPQPQPTQPPAAPQPTKPSGSAWTTDVAITDLYPNSQPKGEVFVRITNNGPGTLNSVTMNVSCSTERLSVKGVKSSGGTVSFIVSLSIKPGETQNFATGINIDTAMYQYTTTCEAHPGFTDPNSGNNQYSEVY